MRMEAFREQLKASALQAAMVAQSIATTGLDEMAAADEYVQSEGYNQTKKKHHNQSSIKPSHSEDASSLIGSTQSSSHTRDSSVYNVGSSHARTTKKAFSFSSSSDEENDTENDPILSILRKEKSSTDHPPQQQRKETHRFMDDLDRRLAQIPTSSEHDPPPISYSYSGEEAPIGSISAWWSTAATSMGIPTAKKKGLSSPAVVAPLARNKPRPPGGRMEDHHVELVSSTAMLGEAEMQQLDQLRSLERQSAQYGPVRVLYDKVMQHRREVFIVVTLVLCAYVYFHATRV